MYANYLVTLNPAAARIWLKQLAARLSEQRAGGRCTVRSTSTYAPQTPPSDADPRLRSALIAGVISGVVGLLVFLIIHHVWITPIWFILPAGLLIAGLSGLAVGWSFAGVQPRLPARPWIFAAVFALMAATLAPAILLAETLPPAADTVAEKLLVTTNELIVRFIFGLLAPATLVGALEGWILLRTWRGAAVTALAGLLLALGLGHNIPFLGHTPAVAKEIALLVAPTLAASLTLVKTYEWLERDQALSDAAW
jgi:tetrahydromethanopterin S-methyltransferase subunit F